MVKKETHGFIGTGTIGNMLIDRLREENIIKKENILFSNSNSTNKSVIKKSDIIYLCVRPQKLEEVFPKLKDNLDNKVLISTVAGIPSAHYHKKLGQIELLRTIPSITNKIGGTIIVCPGKFLKEENKEKAYFNLRKIARIYEVEEKTIDKYTHILSCSPAIVSEFASQYIKSVCKDKDEYEEASKLISDVLINTGKLMEKEGFEIIKQVCTRNGISKDGVEYMKKHFPMQDLTDSLMSKMDLIREKYGT